MGRIRRVLGFASETSQTGVAADFSFRFDTETAICDRLDHFGDHDRPDGLKIKCTRKTSGYLTAIIGAKREHRVVTHVSDVVSISVVIVRRGARSVSRRGAREIAMKRVELDVTTSDNISGCAINRYGKQRKELGYETDETSAMAYGFERFHGKRWK